MHRESFITFVINNKYKIVTKIYNNRVSLHNPQFDMLRHFHVIKQFHVGALLSYINS